MHNTRFRIVVTTYNNEAWIGRCLHSIAAQRFEDYSCVIIDDASTDGTWREIERFEHSQSGNRYRIVRNNTRRGKLANLNAGFDLMNVNSSPDAVLVTIDGDDWLFSHTVLEYVNDVYTQTGCLLTWGNHVHHPSGKRSNCIKLPRDVVLARAFRSYPRFVTSHLKTFSARLWHAIRDEDLRDPNGLFGPRGAYLPSAVDVAFMMPMLEMAAPRIQFVEEILYVYNRENPLSDDRLNPALQQAVERYVRSLPPYESFFQNSR